jgi:hypothetical protein
MPEKYVRERVSESGEFYKQFNETNPGLVMLFIVLTLGFYMINWFYLRNKELELIDKNSPDSKRGAVILFFIPFSYALISFVLRALFFEKVPLWLVITDSIMWFAILLISLKYFYDFCSSFAFITGGTKMVWFSFLSISLLGLYSSFFISYYLTVPFAFFFVVTIPAMQAELNRLYQRKTLKKNEGAFYDI